MTPDLDSNLSGCTGFNSIGYLDNSTGEVSDLVPKTDISPLNWLLLGFQKLVHVTVCEESTDLGTSPSVWFNDICLELTALSRDREGVIDLSGLCWFFGVGTSKGSIDDSLRVPWSADPCVIFQYLQLSENLCPS
ncbi:hypothetical protein WICPIJ_004912 [Wickerhamomyces pijperi]|uniref:Uncharacterized protein n=1 Tax=Wickerhamomyces pijperi TaxID=599730 RepID=A0A9P8Q4X3_WICPI|nr:hypothetical protein WICPIJ_004912 [Wickerhamomyces pijperi]